MAEIHAACFPAYPRAWSRDEIDSVLDSRHSHLFTTQGGFAICRFAGPEAELLTIAVHPRFRRRGAATEMLEEMCRQARHAGVEEIFLEVAQDNTAAISLYGRAGFVQVAVRENYYNGPNGQKINGLVMLCDLTG